ncbi:MAG: HD domain-containing protein [Acidobacteriia bacterium]|nr:HD domain-containing protein [Terriglobia bacterium]
MERSRTRRVRILYLLLVILIGISVVPLWIYTSNMMARNREYLETQENILQSTTSQSLAREISLYLENLQQRLKEFFEQVVPLAASVEGNQYASDRRLREALQEIVTDWPMALYATVLNTEARGVQAGGYNAAADAFLRKALEAAFIAVRQGTLYQSDPITIVRNGKSEPVMVWASPITVGNEFRGMVAVVLTLAPVLERLQETRRTGLEAYIVDNSGRLVASNVPDKNVPGKDMVGVPIVQMFLAWRGAARATETRKFPLTEGNETVEMLGTYSPIQNVNWGVIVQKRLSDAYFVVDEMRRRTLGWGLVVILLNVLVAVFAAKSVTKPLESLTQTARSFAERQYTQRADVRSRIQEVAHLAEGFNQAGEEIQRYIGDLKAASDMNRQLFRDSIRMIASAVDAKDPYTKGHSGRVSDYSVILAKELGLPEDEVEKVETSAILHDVGKIGIKDNVLNKEGVLTQEEFDLMKRHTVMGYEIVRQVSQLHEMLPGIRWHHEALNGKGYPDGVTGDELPLMVRIISVADTFDAVTTDRPYQDGRPFPQALEILRKHAGSKYDPIVVDALHSAYAKGALHHYELQRKEQETLPQPTA